MPPQTSNTGTTTKVTDPQAEASLSALHPPDPTGMTNDQTDAPKPFGWRLSEETTEENKKLLAKIDSKSLLLTSTVNGSLYFHIDAHDTDNPSKEELIDDPSALDSASNELGIDIRNENKHHRWVAQMSQTLKILEFATINLSQKNYHSSSAFGVNVELKWQDECDQEIIIHLTQSKDQPEWQVTRYA